MKTAIRLDDISTYMNLEKFEKVRKILMENKIAPLIGVIPFSPEGDVVQGEARMDYMAYIHGLRSEGWVCALHGCNHVYTTSEMGIFPLNDFSEFAGVPYKEQLSKIRRGKEQLESLGIITDIFMAPAHTFDRNTIRALKKCGITKITDGFGSKPYKFAGMVFYPIARRRKDCISMKPGYTTMVLHTETMTDEEIEQFGEMIRENRSHFINYSEFLQVKPWRRNQFDKMREYIEAWCKFKLVKIKVQRREKAEAKKNA